MIKLIVVLTLLCSSAWAAGVPSDAAFEVEAAGASTNGGCFSASNIGATGVDKTFGAGQAITTFTSSLSGVATTALTDSGAGFTTAMLGNCVNIVGQGFYAITAFTSSSVVTVDRTLGTFSSTSGKLGGALSFPVDAAAAVQPGNTVYVKAGTYSIGASQTFSTTAGTAGSPISITGFTTTRTDGGQVTLTQSTTSIVGFSLTLAYYRVSNFIIDCATKTGSQGITAAGNYTVVSNCKVLNSRSVGITASGTGEVVINCVVSGATTGSVFAANTGSGMYFIGCRATGNNINGFATSSGSSIYDHCISDNNTGASVDGFQNTSTSPGAYLSCVAYGNGRDGIRYTTTLNNTIIRNCILAANAVSATGYGINSTTTNWTSTFGSGVDYNFHWLSGETAASNQIAAGAHDVTLSGNPFNGSGSNDFSLNNTALAGASVRAAGFPGVMQSGGTGSLDGGALQSAPGGGGNTYIFPIFR